MITIVASILGGSIVLMAIMCLSKSFELQTGRGLLPLVAHPTLNSKVSNWSNAGLENVKSINKHTVRDFFHFLLVQVENVAIALFLKLGKRFHKIGDMITGKDLPKNRGSVSTFLMNIDHPRNMPSLASIKNIDQKIK